MLQGHELTTPIQYGYLILAGILILMACIAGIIYIIRDIRATATSEPDYLAYWKNLNEKKKVYYEPPFGQWIQDQWLKEAAEEVKKEMDSWRYPIIITLKSEGGPCSGSDKRNPISIYQSLTKPPFHWENFLDDVINGRCSAEQIDRAKALSAHFQTCPCGQLDPDIPRREDGEPGEPEDEELCILGAEFWQALCMDDYYRARDIYHQIKARETHLLNLPQSGL